MYQHTLILTQLCCYMISKDLIYSEAVTDAGNSQVISQRAQPYQHYLRDQARAKGRNRIPAKHPTDTALAKDSNFVIPTAVECPCFYSTILASQITRYMVRTVFAA